MSLKLLTLSDEADEFTYSDSLGLFYKVFYDPLLSLADAKVYCHTQCGTLLRIDTAEKQQYVEYDMELKEYSGHTTFYIDGEKSGTIVVMVGWIKHYHVLLGY